MSNYSIMHWSSLSHNLSEVLNFSGHVVPTEASLLQKYEADRKTANIVMMAILDGFQKAYSVDFGPLNFIRATAFYGGNYFPPLKKISSHMLQADAKTILNTGGSVEAANKIVHGDKERSSNWLIERLIKKKEPKDKSATSITCGASDQYVADLTTRIRAELTKDMDEKVDRKIQEMMKKFAEKHPEEVEHWRVKCFRWI